MSQHRRHYDLPTVNVTFPQPPTERKAVPPRIHTYDAWYAGWYAGWWAGIATGFAVGLGTAVLAGLLR